jgi:hypothetical protein
VALAGLLAAPLAAGQLSLLAFSTALAVGIGAEAHARLHPGFSRSTARFAAGFWIGPALAVLAAALTAARLEDGMSRVLPLVGTLAVALLIFAQDRELSGPSEERWTPLAYALILYLTSFALFVVIYDLRAPIALLALVTGVCAALLSAALFRPTRAQPGRIWLLAALTGLCVMQLDLALGLWIEASLLVGAFLLLYFYVSTGLLQAFLDGSLDGRLAAEYGFVGLVGLLLILSATPLRG